MVEVFPYIAIIDVGHGNSCVLFDNSNCFVIDCGLGSSIFEFLKQEGLFEIDSVFLSHSDQDHIGGLIGLISSDEFKIHNVYVIADATKVTNLWDGLLYSLSHSSLNGGTKLHVSISTSEGPFKCGSILLKVVSPTPYLAGKSAGNTTQRGEKITSNSVSASFHVEWNGNSIVYLAGDIDQVSLNEIIEHNIPLESQVLVFPHHGGTAGGYDLVSFTTTLCNLTKASTVLFSIGRNKHDNPRTEVVQTVRSIIPEVRIACTQLSKRCANALPQKSPNHLLSFFAKGKATRECCAGTFIIKLGEQIEYLPVKKEHQKFILDFAPTSLCNPTKN
jgi:beta-lactamase superfamily II metal-dependent hydrolase